MKKLILVLALFGLVASALTAPVAARKGPPKKAKKSQQAPQAQNGSEKAWICHLASHKYVAVRVSLKAFPGHQRHGDDITAAVPQTSRQAARAFCAAQQVLTPRRGGSERDGSLTSAQAAGVTAELDVRARLGQGKVCFRLRLAGATGATSLVISRDGAEVATTPTLTSLLDAGTTSTGCAAVTRELARQILRSPSDFTATAVVTTAGGPVTLTGPLTR
jgi:hypothetical protein